MESRFPHLENIVTSKQRPPVNDGHYFWETNVGRCALVGLQLIKKIESLFFVKLVKRRLRNFANAHVCTSNRDLRGRETGANPIKQISSLKKINSLAVRFIIQNRRCNLTLMGECHPASTGKNKKVIEIPPCQQFSLKGPRSEILKTLQLLLEMDNFKGNF